MLKDDAPLIASGAKTHVFDSHNYKDDKPDTYNQRVFYRDLGEKPMMEYVRGYTKEFSDSPVRAFLGSYQGRVTIDPGSIDMVRHTATVFFRAHNVSGLESGTRLPPPYGYTHRSDGSPRATIVPGSGTGILDLAEFNNPGFVNPVPHNYVPRNWTNIKDWVPKAISGDNPFTSYGPMHNRSQDIVWAEKIHF